MKLSVPADATTLMAVIAEGDDAGTAEVSDDVFTMTGIGIVKNLQLRAWRTSTVTVGLLDDAQTARATIAHGPSSDILQEVVGVPGITFDHQLILYPPLGSASSTFLVPTASGDFAGLKLWAVATAGNDTNTDWSRSYERGVPAPADSETPITLSTSGFLGLPTVDEHAPSRYSVSSTTALNRLELMTPDGEELNALLFPPQTEFEVPAGVLAGHPTEISIEAFDWELDPHSFAFQDLIGQTRRIAYARVQPLGR